MTPLLITHSINSNEADFILMHKVKEFKKETRSSKTSKKKDTPYTRIKTLTFVKESKIEHKNFNIKQSLEGNETPFKQECIPVGCVPPAHWPYLIVSEKTEKTTHAPPPE